MTQVTIYNNVNGVTPIGTFNMTVPLAIESETRAFRDETLSLRIVTNSSNAQRWNMNFGLAADGGTNQTAALFSVHKATHNISQQFSVTMPQHHYVDALTDSDGNPITVTVNGAVNLSTTDVTMIPTTGGTTPVGRFISFAGHSKIYLVTASTETTTSIFPPLRSNLADASTVNQSPVVNVFYSDNDDQSISYSDGILSEISLSLVEAL